MELSLPALITCSISMSLLSIILYIALRWNYLLKKVGILSVYILMILTIIRGCFPLDIYKPGLTKTYESLVIIPAIQKIIMTPVTYENHHSFSVLDLIIIMWIVIGSFLFIKKSVGYYRLKQKISQMPRLSSNNINQVYQRAFLNVFKSKNHNIEVIKMEGISTPAAFGLFHPVILLPNIEFTETELYCVLLHELIHIKHRDWGIKVIMDFISCIHWWNVCVSILLPSMLQQIQELYVDHSMEAIVPTQNRLDYANSILKTLRHAQSNRKQVMDQTSYYALCNMSNKKNLRQRFYYIEKWKHKKKSNTFIAFAVILFIFSFTFVFEARNLPEYDQNGDDVFYLEKDNSYYLKNGNFFDLYLNGEYFYTTEDLTQVPNDFKDLPIYEKGDFK